MSGKRELKRKLNFCIKKYSYVTEDSIDLSFMPPLSRRKLSLADKLALCAMNECYETPEVKIVFASQYGEIDRLDKIITQYTEENEVSPATFSGSVHNSAPGAFSLLKKITCGYNAMAAEENTFSSGLVEAAASAGDTDVLFCCCDTKNEVFGFSCLITKDEGRKFTLNICESPVKKTFDKTEIERFLELMNGNSDMYWGDGGLFTVTG